MHLTCLNHSSYFPFLSITHREHTTESTHFVLTDYERQHNTWKRFTMWHLHKQVMVFVQEDECIDMICWQRSSFLIEDNSYNRKHPFSWNTCCWQAKVFPGQGSQPWKLPTVDLPPQQRSSVSASTGAAWYARISASTHTFPRPCDNGNEPKRASIAVSFFFFFGSSSMLTSNVGSAASCCRGISPQQESPKTCDVGRELYWRGNILAGQITGTVASNPSQLSSWNSWQQDDLCLCFSYGDQPGVAPLGEQQPVTPACCSPQ